jgi:hypothetical protein
MSSVLKWGLIILAAYLVWKWWQSQQVTAAPAWTPGLTGSVYGGGIIAPPGITGATYQPYSVLPPAQTIVANGNPGYTGPGYVFGTATPVLRFGTNTSVPSVNGGGLAPANPVNYLGLVGVRPVGPTPNFGGTAY